MAKMLLSRADFREVLSKRRRARDDRFDEVWNGIYVMSQSVDIEHHGLAYHLTTAIDQAIGGVAGGIVLPGGNVSDREEGWAKNYRYPDVASYLVSNPARNCGTHWFGGPDFAVEILSRGDCARKKFAFYAAVGVRELLLIDRSPWRLELYRLHNGTLASAGTATADDGIVLRSSVLPLTFRLLPAEPRPRIEVAEANALRRWSM